MLKAHRRTLSLLALALVSTFLFAVVNPPTNVLTIGLAALTVAPGAISAALDYQKMQKNAGVGNDALEAALIKLREHNDRLERRITLAVLDQANEVKALQLRTPTFDYISEGVRAKKNRLLREVEETTRPTSRAAREAQRSTPPRTRTLYDGRVVPVEGPPSQIEESSQIEEYDAGREQLREQLDPAFEWEEAHEIGSYEPIFIEGRCLHLPEFVEKVRLGGDDSDGPIVAHLCTKCGSQLPGEGEWA